MKWIWFYFSFQLNFSAERKTQTIDVKLPREIRRRQEKTANPFFNGSSSNSRASNLNSGVGGTTPYSMNSSSSAGMVALGVNSKDLDFFKFFAIKYLPFQNQKRPHSWRSCFKYAKARAASSDKMICFLLLYLLTMNTHSTKVSNQYFLTFVPPSFVPCLRLSVFVITLPEITHLKANNC